MKKRRARWLAVSLAIVLIGVAALLAWRGDWRYRVSRLLKPYRTLTFSWITPDGFSERAVEELLSDARVTVEPDLLLINRDHPIPKGYSPTLIECESFLMEGRVAESYDALKRVVFEKTGDQLCIRSAYRDANEQSAEHQSAEMGVAAPMGYSEHECGLALDICVPGYGGMSFLKTRAGRYVGDHCAEFGFIIRYPDAKTKITGYTYEPWHLRYVGRPHAEIIMASGITLEEYFEALLPDTYLQSGDYLLYRTKCDSFRMPTDFISCTVTVDHLGYRIFAFEMKGE
jgi:D-alanyl-D-alanine carboxypeptidase